jgi:hypothetical protein
MVGLSGLVLIILCITTAILVRHFEKGLNGFFAYRGTATWTSSPTTVAPAPRLQPDPARELAEMRAQEDALLHSYGWVDRSAGVVRIPIERAMQLTLDRGLPVRKSVPKASPAPAP